MLQPPQQPDAILAQVMMQIGLSQPPRAMMVRDPAAVLGSPTPPDLLDGELLTDA